MTAIPGLPEGGFLRLRQIVNQPAKDGKPAKVGLIPVSRATFLNGVKSGRYPQPTRALGRKITAWSVASLRAFIESAAAQAGEASNAGKGEGTGAKAGDA